MSFNHSSDIDFQDFFFKAVVVGSIEWAHSHHHMSSNIITTE